MGRVGCVAVFTGPDGTLCSETPDKSCCQACSHYLCCGNDDHREVPSTDHGTLRIMNSCPFHLDRGAEHVDTQVVRRRSALEYLLVVACVLIYFLLVRLTCRTVKDWPRDALRPFPSLCITSMCSFPITAALEHSMSVRWTSRVCGPPPHCISRLLLLLRRRPRYEGPSIKPTSCLRLPAEHAVLISSTISTSRRLRCTWWSSAVKFLYW